MRYFLFCALAALLFLAPSCKKDKSTAELLNGKWNVTRLVADGEDPIQGDPDYRIEIELEFTNGGSLVFNVTEYDMSVTPVDKSSYALVASYSIASDNLLTINLNDGMDNSTVTGPIEIKNNHFVYTPTSGDTTDFISLMEADKK